MVTLFESVCVLRCRILCCSLLVSVCISSWRWFGDDPEDESARLEAYSECFRKEQGLAACSWCTGKLLSRRHRDQQGGKDCYCANCESWRAQRPGCDWFNEEDCYSPIH